MSQAGSTLGGGGGGGVTSVSGTANRITSTGGATPVIDIAATYVGQTSITTLGTVTAGTWNGSTIGVPYGGTGATTLTNHGVLIGQGTSAIAATAAGTAGQVLQSGGAAADPLYSTATYPSTATGTGTVLRADGTNWVATTATYPNTVSQANILYGSASNVVSGLAPTSPLGGFPTYDGTNVVWFDPRAYVYHWDDFITTVQTGGDFSILGWTRISGSGGSISYEDADQEAGRPGVVRIFTGVTASGNAGLIAGNNTAHMPMLIGGGRIVTEFFCKIPVLSDATDTFTVMIGWFSNNASNAEVCGFSYNSGVNSGNWQMITKAAGTTTTNSNTAADTSWHRYTIDMNAGGTSVGFYIDGVQLTNSPVATNLPTATFGPCVQIIRTAGSSNSRWVLFDLYTHWQALTSSR